MSFGNGMLPTPTRVVPPSPPEPAWRIRGLTHPGHYPFGVEEFVEGDWKMMRGFPDIVSAVNWLGIQCRGGLIFDAEGRMI